MRVILQKNNQFGPTGPKKGSAGEAQAVLKNSDGEVMLAVFFTGVPGTFWVYLDDVLMADTSGTATFYRSWEEADLTAGASVS